ncbi:GNAT family N-acetyltransferase [Salinactinospora qingdaonensis]|uniref:GNAT family N-acetyltransferase n=1 Tax=Salinactinospora qingdaonensis TaxID=702744 RepID=UPI0031E7AED0
MLDVALARGAQERAAVFAIREAVFVVEQQVPLEQERDPFDAHADHFLARVDGAPVGAGRLVSRHEVGVLGRLAVLSQARGVGVGGALAGAVEERARALGLHAIELHAQVHALGFYERLGYTSYGPRFVESGIEHVAMRKPLG